MTLESQRDDSNFESCEHLLARLLRTAVCFGVLMINNTHTILTYNSRNGNIIFLPPASLRGKITLAARGVWRKVWG